MERFHPEDLPDSPCEVVNVSKQAEGMHVSAFLAVLGCAWELHHDSNMERLNHANRHSSQIQPTL